MLNNLKEIETAYLKAQERCWNRCCLLHADTLNAVPELIAEVKRLQRLEAAVAAAWEQTQVTIANT